jgi:hypothetical protein
MGDERPLFQRNSAWVPRWVSGGIIGVVILVAVLELILGISAVAA